MRGKAHRTRKIVANISSKQFESKAVLNVLMNFDDGPKKKAIHRRGGDNFVYLPSERASDAADRNATWVWGDGRGRKVGRGKMQRKKMELLQY